MKNKLPENFQIGLHKNINLSSASDKKSLSNASNQT